MDRVGKNKMQLLFTFILVSVFNECVLPFRFVAIYQNGMHLYLYL